MACKSESLPPFISAGFVFTLGAIASASSASSFDRVADAWGDNTDGQAAQLVVPGIDLVQIDGGHFHSIALDEAGRAYAWGWNVFGQSTVPPLGTVVSVAAGCEHSLACLDSGQVVGWGRNQEGQCTPPSGLRDATAVSAGDNHSYALRASGTVACWGQNNEGQCVPPSGLSGLSAVEAGGAHGLALRTDGTVAGWGWNYYAQTSVPSGLGSVTAISAGGEHSVALRSNGQVVCWGSNTFGQCAAPADLPAVTAIAAGGAHTLALSASGRVIAWGWNNEGQRVVPVSLSGARAIGAGGKHSLAIIDAAAVNQRTGERYVRLDEALLEVQTNDVLLTPESGADQPFLDYGERQFEIRGGASIVRPGGSTTLFGPGCRMTAAASLDLGGTVTCPPATVTRVGAGSLVRFSGECTVLPGGSLQVLPETGGARIDGSLNVLSAALLAPELDVGAVGRLNMVGGSFVGALSTASGSVSTVSGALIGAVVNAGRMTAIGETSIVGDVTNTTTGEIVAQVGVVYIAGDLSNDGELVGNVIEAPPLADGGGTQPGDGVRIGGSLAIGAEGSLRLPQHPWLLSVCGNASFACPSSNIELDEATMLIEGCADAIQAVEVTSADLGCTSAAFEDELKNVSRIGSLALGAGTTVLLVDEFDNDGGAGTEAIYVGELVIPKGSMLVTNGIRIVTRSAVIDGAIDDEGNLCIVPTKPNPDINGDGLVNGIDLAYVLTHWGTNTAFADVDRDGTVGASDLSLVLGGWSAS